MWNINKKRKWGVGIIVALWLLTPNLNESFGCNDCDGNFAGYKNTPSMFMNVGEESCLYDDSCYEKPQEWADPPPLDYRVKKNVCFC